MVQEIKHLFPNAVIGVDIIFKDDGNGVYIDQWNLQATQPTQAEINAVTTIVQGISSTSAKWEQVKSQWDALTITTNQGHTFAANKEAIRLIDLKANNMLDTDIILWVEDWGSFNTNIIELKEVMNLASTAHQAIVNSIFGV